MKFGFIPTEGGQYYGEALREVVRGEELGFDSVWMEEHHGVHNHYWPSPMMVLAGFATQTSKIMLGSDVAILPFYHPVHAAEGAAMLDVMSNGRFIFGVAIGYRADEFAAFDAPMERRGARFVEMIALMRRLWTEEEVTFEGKFYRKEKVRLEPKPYTAGGVPIWIGGWGDLTLSRAAELADAWVPGPTAKLDKLLSAQKVYKAALAKAGKDAASVPSPLTREVIIADTSERARELAEKHLLVNYRDEYGGGWGHPLISAESKETQSDLDQIGKDRFIVGNPEECIAKIRFFQEQFGVDHLICRLYFPGMPHEHIMRELELLSKEVFPAFQ
jgi:probable F420-dependent oxidoreductase